MTSDNARAAAPLLVLLAVLVATLVICTGSASEAPPAPAAPPVVAASERAVAWPGTAVPWQDRRRFRTWSPPAPTSSGWPTEPPERFRTIRVRLVLPDSATAGEPLEYQRLRGGRTERRLACDDAPLLWPRGRRTYAMRAEVPEAANGAELLVSWGLVDNLADNGAQGWVPLTQGPAGST